MTDRPHVPRGAPVCPECGSLDGWREVSPTGMVLLTCAGCGYEWRDLGLVSDSRLNSANVVTTRPDGTTDESRRPGKRKLYRRLRLRRHDGVVYLDRHGIAHDRIGGVLLHRMDGPDPGRDLHDHPWWFVSIILWGGYTEERVDVRRAPRWAWLAEHDGTERGVECRRRVGSVRTMRLDECHTVTALNRRRSWSLVIRGPKRRDRDAERAPWGFFLPSGWMDEQTYDETVRVNRRDLWNERG